MSIQSLLSNQTIVSDLKTELRLYSRRISLIVSPNYSVPVFGSTPPTISQVASVISNDVVNISFRVLVNEFNYSENLAPIVELTDFVPPSYSATSACLITDIDLGITTSGIGTIKFPFPIPGQPIGNPIVYLQNVNNYDLKGHPATIDFNITYII